jgi:ATP-dependent helicase/nuclease subunit A
MTDLQDAPARARITSAHGETLFVDAGAGTGKTRQLVERVVALVAAGWLTSIASLAAITFTENAAAELRTRIREALEDAANSASQWQDAERDRCARALAELDDAAITTLHGFAARLLTDWPLEAGLPPVFEMADAVSAGIERDRWWRSRLDEWLADPGLAPAWRLGLTLGLKPADLDKIVEPFDAHWDLLPGISFGPAGIPAADRVRLLKPLRAVGAFAGKGPDGDRMAAHIDEVLLPLLREAEAEDDALQVLSMLHATHVLVKCGSTPDWRRQGADLTQVRELCQQICDRRDEQLRNCGTAVAAALLERLRLAVLAHAEERRRSGALSFHDLLVLAVRMLRDNPAARAAVHDRWQAILVDEFQDTDPLQVELLHLIAGEGDGTWQELPVAGGRLFFVGDRAQSIYRFRRAELGLFSAVREQYPASRVSLLQNFRSRPAILNVVNAAFGQLFAGSGQVSHADLRAARDGVPGDKGPDVLLLGGPLDQPIGRVRDVEATHVAATLYRAQAEGWLITGRDGQARPAGYSDMAVLVPARTSLSQLEDALERYDVPYRVMSRSLVWETDAIRDLVTVLQAIDDPDDGVAVIAALRHPMFGCSDDDLVGWKAAGGSWRYDAPAPADPGGSPVAEAMRALLRYHDLRWWLPVNVLLDRIIRERRAVELTAAHRRPRDQWRRIRFLADQARAYLDNGGSGLRGFIRWARGQIDSAADAVETAIPERDDDAIQILTIHSAKGLEFPVVVLTGINAQRRPAAEVIWHHGRVPEVRVRKGFETPGFQDAQQSDRQLDEQEDLRLLYVAMTRAADHLAISLYHSPPSNGVPNNHAMRLFALVSQLADAGAAHQQSAPDCTAPADARRSTPMAISLKERERFLAERCQLLARLTATAPTTATGLAHDAGVHGTAREPADRLIAAHNTEAADAQVRRSMTHSGATVGSAVHRALELLDLGAPTEQAISFAVETACGELSSAQLTGAVRVLVQSALRSPVMRLAGTCRHWKEVPIVADIGGRIVEGFIDLLVDTSDGLIVVDYKTDQVRSGAECEEKAAAYAPQITAYATALASTGLQVHRALLCFIGTDTVSEMQIATAQ